eukprot:CAMPEP_0171283342 /NCGR_PEP_ID=MMETSP0790-20130122/67388_1 /TAXON_ID=2925 /ORGANISM="Alexandrium catenella, Strain OF101" /LENGTH=100 /DNA_ID=CAMNT_0011752633 /DNA_START=169 /DNA_END=471 /DNA_ORIENTATION=-
MHGKVAAEDALALVLMEAGKVDAGNVDRIKGIQDRCRPQIGATSKPKVSPALEAGVCLPAPFLHVGKRLVMKSWVEVVVDAARIEGGMEAVPVAYEQVWL